MTHTKGPWTYKLQEPSDDYVSKKPFWYVIRGADGRILCKIWHLQEPDARLIAAAPMLLAACEKAVETLDDDAPGPGLTMRELIRDLYAAIAKARGDA